eukprot:scaffold549_cov385-Prasinococcus_capsulatus_cf.AAC.7
MPHLLRVVAGFACLYCTAIDSLGIPHTEHKKQRRGCQGSALRARRRPAWDAATVSPKRKDNTDSRHAPSPLPSQQESRARGSASIQTP